MSFFQTHTVKIIVGAATSALLIKYLTSSYVSKKTSKFIIIQSINDWNKHENEILRTFENSEVIGIDCEWVTTEDKREPVSLLQLATSEEYCVLVRLSCIPAWLIPVGLGDILRDKNIIKVGVGVSEDANKLFQDYCLEVRGFVDLRFLVKDLKELQGKSLGLKSLAKELLGYDLDKSKTLRCSDWNAEHLSNEQIKYAADDAIISAKLFDNIKNRCIGWFKLNSKFYEDVDMYLDVSFKQSMGDNINKNVSQDRTGLAVRRVKKWYSNPRSKPLYDNCQLVAPDGEILCSCERSKAQWYIYKGLGEIINEEPFTVKLNFEPSGRPTLDNIFYTKEKINCCVVCGETKNYHRKLVVPSEYRKSFPNLMKKSLSHDVLLLCVHCHKRSNILDHTMRMKLAKLCDAPLMNSRNAKYQFNPVLVRVKSAAKALITSGDKIPEDRKRELQKIILDYFNVSEMTEELLNEANFADAVILNESFVPHGLKVYQYFCKNGGLIELERLWRQHFLDTMQPKYLPDMWSVEHNHKRLALQVVNHEREVNFDSSILGINPELLEDTEENSQ